MFSVFSDVSGVESLFIYTRSFCTFYLLVCLLKCSYSFFPSINQFINYINIKFILLPECNKMECIVSTWLCITHSIGNRNTASGKRAFVCASTELLGCVPFLVTAAYKAATLLLIIPSTVKGTGRCACFHKAALPTKYVQRKIDRLLFCRYLCVVLWGRARCVSEPGGERK